MLGKNLGKETVYKFIFDFIVFKRKKTSQYGGVPYHLTNVLKDNIILEEASYIMLTLFKITCYYYM